MNEFALVDILFRRVQNNLNLHVKGKFDTTNKKLGGKHDLL